MNTTKMRSLEKIEQKMQDLDTNSVRYHLLQSAKEFKTSWVNLGRALYSVWKDKLYKEWGYANFDIYSTKEIGIKKQTAVKLLKSYYFLEKEEPAYLEKDYSKPEDAARLASFESIDVLRRVKNKKAFTEDDYAGLKREVFENGKDSRDIKRELTALIRQRQELEPGEAWKKKRLATVRRFLGTLKALKQELEISKLLPVAIIQETGRLISKLEEELN